MNLGPPYLLGPRGARDRVTVSVDVDTAVVVMTLHGEWDPLLRRDMYRSLDKCLAEHPAALVVDLRGMTDPHTASVPAWLAVRARGEAMDPPVRVVACVSRDSALADRLHRVGAARFLPVFGCVTDARAAIADRLPLTALLRLSLPPDPDSPALARNLVTDACAAWRLPCLLHRARLVMSELATNAVQHARTPLVVLVSRRHDGLHLVVSDRDPRLPFLRERGSPPPGPGPLWAEPGLGLQVVHGAASGWGAMPTADGKVVWATILPREDVTSSPGGQAPGSRRPTASWSQNSEG